MKVTGDIPNLINGVSQQAAALRLPTQAEAQENCYSTIVNGLKKRPPTEMVAKILDELPEGAYFHIINRDVNERYVVVIVDEDLKVYDFDGNEKTVSFPDGKDYLGAADPAADFCALTIADFTFIANRDVYCATDPSVTEPTRYHEAVINIMAGNYGKDYVVKINGSTVVTHTTPDGSSAAQSPYVATTYIAEQIYNALVLGGYNTAPWAVGIHQNAIHILNTSTDFAIAVSDGANGNATRLAKDKIQKFSDLPNYGPQDFVIEVGNSEGTTLDNYWVKADKGGSNNNSKVVWKECCKPGTILALDGETMPHILIRNEDGTFTFKQADWDQRKCGNGDDISPDPSFVGSTIEDIVFHRNRLGFLADESVILSRAGSFFDFFRTTATALLDDDPIDVASTHIKVSFLKNTIPHQDYLLVFSDQTQFRLAGNDLLTPKTVSIRPLTEFAAATRAKPIGIGPAVFFASDNNDNGNYAAVYEYTLDKAAETANADDITAHAPAYIPSGTFRLTGSSDENLLALLTRGATNSVFVYRYYWVNDEKVQSSWSKWTFGEAQVLEAAFIGSDLYLLMGRDGGAYLEKLRMEPSATDAGMGMMVCLDQRVTEEQLASPTYDALTNKTTYTLPYEVDDTLRAVNRPDSTGVVGSEETITDTTGTTVKLRGNTTTRKLIFGFPYASRYRFSTFFHRAPTAQGGNVTKVEGRLQLYHLTLLYNQSAYFRVEIEKENRDREEYEMSGITVGSPSAVIGEIVLEDGRFNVPIMARNDRVTIDIVNDTWLPSNILSATWRGVWNHKARQV